MKTRKIWSMPLVLVTALLLVGLFAAAVLAQTATSPPRVANQIPNQTLTIAATATDVTDVTIDLADVNGTDTGTPPAFTDFTDTGDPPTADATLVYTAATYDRDIVSVAGLTVADTTATAWWDALGDRADNPDTADDETLDNADCSAKAMRLGFTITPAGDTTTSPAHRAAVGGDTPADATGLCQDSAEIAAIPLHAAVTGGSPEVLADTTTIAVAFHWDMLSGPEMAAVARGAGATGNYAHNFGGLSHAQKVQVLAWFGADNVLTRGTGSITLDHDGINGTDTEADPEGEAGSTTVVVKASDVQGRLIPPGDGSTTVGQSFTVTAKLTATGDISAFVAAADATSCTTDTSCVIGLANGAGVAFVDGGDDPDRYDLTVGTDATGNIAQVIADVEVASLAPHHQRLEIIVRNDDENDDRFETSRELPATTDLQRRTANIAIKKDSVLVRDEIVNLTLQVNELGNVGPNNERIDLQITVVQGGEAPMIDREALNTHFDNNPVKVTEHMAEDTDVGTAGLPIDFSDYVDADARVTYSITDTGPITIDSSSGEVTLRDPSVGATYDFDTPANNTIKYTLTADDGARSATYSFDVEIVTNKPVARTLDPDADGYEAVSLDTGAVLISVMEEDLDGDGPKTDMGNVARITVGTPTDGIPQDDRGVAVVDVAELLDPTPFDPSELNVIGIPTAFGSPLDVDRQRIVLDYVPDARNTTPEYTLVIEGTVTIDDDYANADPPVADEQIKLVITVHVAEPPTVGSHLEQVRLPENSTDPLADTADIYEPEAGSTVEPFYHYASGTGNAAKIAADGTAIQSHFDVNSETGQVTVLTAQDFETEPNSHTISIRVTDGSDDRDETGPLLALHTILIDEIDVNEAPTFDAATMTLNANENAAADENVGDPIMASDVDAGDSITYSITETDVPFKVVTVDHNGGKAAQIQKTGDANLRLTPAYSVTLVATDSGTPAMTASLAITITVGDVNDAPSFVDAQLEVTIPEDLGVGDNVLLADSDGDVDADGKFNASDPDNNDVKFFVETATDTTVFALDMDTGILTLLKKLDYETTKEYELDIKVEDVPGEGKDALEARTELKIHVTDVNDNPPVFATDNTVSISVMENSSRGTPLTSAIASGGVYAATDADGTAPNNEITYSIDHKSFHIDASTGLLTVLESLDADTGTPCGATGCVFKITATDGGTPSMSDTLDVTVSVLDAFDSVSTFAVSKPNPVPGISMGNPDSALADTKEGKYGIAERPSDQPATEGDAPHRFVEADYASWGTVLRIAVTAESPHADCGKSQPGNNNQCVWIDVDSDSAGNKLRLEAYRSSAQENLFVAAIMLVEENPTDDGDDKDGDRNSPVHKDDDSAGVVQLETDEEDEVTFRLLVRDDSGNTGPSNTPPYTIEVENEDPEFNNFMPEHEAAFDDGDVEYTFTITDPVSGIPEPEDLASDTDGDKDYMPLVALISDTQCHSEAPTDKKYKKVDSDLTAGNDLWCKSAPVIRQIVDDRDFDEIDDGFDVATEIVLPENKARYVTFIVCDNAGNCAMYTPDENATDEALAEITIDTEDPDLIEARTGIKWDATDSEYDDDSSFIQLLFNDLTALDPTSIENDDFVIEGHTIKAVHWYDVSDGDDDTAWGDDDASTTPSRFAMGGSTTKRGHPLRQSIRNAVFIELEDELAPDETPDVSIVPNGILDSAGNEQDDDEVEADDWIAPSFTVSSIVSSRTPEGSSNQLAGDGDEVVITLTSDERIQQTRPQITVTYVNAPAGCVNTANRQDDASKANYNPYDRGQIKTGGDCGSNATGGTLGTTFERISNTEWIVTVDEPDDTGYYNIHIEGNDRSEQRNKGSEGIAAGDIEKKFFERDGDVNSDDAHYFQGDINLSNPGVRVSGVQIEDTEPTVEFKTPLFVELDFTRPYLEDCADDLDDDDRDANCYAESDEYAKDSFDSVTVTSFTLNGVDMTDSVKTTDDETFLVSIEGIEIGDHEIEIMAMDEAGNTLDKALSVEFEVEERDDFSKRLNPGWNLVSIPGEPADSDISTVFGHDLEVRTVYTYNPIIPGGWMVAVRESADAEWQGDLKEITARQGYWVLSDAIQDWDVSIPRLAGGAVGSGTPIQPPVIALYAGWNLVPVIDVTGDFSGGGISAGAYLQSLDDGLDLARVLGFDTITNKWSTVMAPEGSSGDDLEFGRAYWVFVRQAASLVPGN